MAVTPYLIAIAYSLASTAMILESLANEYIYFPAALLTEKTKSVMNKVHSTVCNTTTVKYSMHPQTFAFLVSNHARRASYQLNRGSQGKGEGSNRVISCEGLDKTTLCGFLNTTR